MLLSTLPHYDKFLGADFMGFISATLLGSVFSLVPPRLRELGLISHLITRICNSDPHQQQLLIMTFSTTEILCPNMCKTFSKREEILVSEHLRMRLIKLPQISKHFTSNMKHSVDTKISLVPFVNTDV